MLLTGTGVDLLAAFDLFFWILGACFLGFAFFVGKYVAKLHRKLIAWGGRAIDTNWNPMWMDLSIRGVVVLLGVIAALTSRVPFRDILDSVLLLPILMIWPRAFWEAMGTSL